MANVDKYYRVRTLLASCAVIALFVSLPAHAQTNSLEDRVQRLETLLEQILERMDNQKAEMDARDQEVITQTQALIEKQQLSDERVGRVQEVIAGLEEAQKAGDPIGFKVGGTTFTMGGYTKLDVNMTRYSDGDRPAEDLGDDFYLPQVIPVAAGGSSEGWDNNWNMRDTRVWINAAAPAGDSVISARIEFDFQAVGTNADERATNGYSPELRHAFISYHKWMFGQNWSTFFNVSTLPDDIDFVGPTEGTVFVRQPQIRYTDGPFSVALENPETVVTPFGGGRALSNDGGLPDVVVAFKPKTETMSFMLAAVGRQLSCDGCVGGIDDDAFGWGLGASGLIKVGEKDDIRFQANYGEGLGRYLGVNIINDAAIDPATGKLEPIGVFNGFIAYRHEWAPGVRSSIYGAYLKADNPVALTGAAQTDEIYSGHVNLLWSPAPKLTLGVKYLHGVRKLENGLKGHMDRVQFSTKYVF